MRRAGPATLVLAAVFMWSSQVLANTVTQNVSWTIDRAGTSTKYRVVAYGDVEFLGVLHQPQPNHGGWNRHASGHHRRTAEKLLGTLTNKPKARLASSQAGFFLIG